MMLTEIGFDDSRQRIQSRWSELIKLAIESPPPRYELAYPPKLLEGLTQFFWKDCEAFGLKKFDSESSDGVAAMIHDCWSQFREKPETYADHERKALEELLTELRA